MIESASYGPDGQTIVVTLADGTVLLVPDDMSNSSRKELAEWETDGGVIAPYVAPPPTAEEVRIAAVKADTNRATLLAMLRGATPAQIDTWFVNNVPAEGVTNLAQAKAVLIQMRTVVSSIVKLIATQLPDS